jgi:hypothetical protein
MYRNFQKDENIKNILDIISDKYIYKKKLLKYKVLEIGCGIGIESRLLCNFFYKYIAINKDE